MWNDASPSFPKALRQPEPRTKALRQPNKTLEAPLESDTDDSEFEPVTEKNHAQAVITSICNPLLELEWRDAIRDMAQEEIKRILVEQAGSSLQKATREKL